MDLENYDELSAHLKQLPLYDFLLDSDKQCPSHIDFKLLLILFKLYEFGYVSGSNSTLMHPNMTWQEFQARRFPDPIIRYLYDLRLIRVLDRDDNKAFDNTYTYCILSKTGLVFLKALHLDRIFTKLAYKYNIEKYNEHIIYASQATQKHWKRVTNVWLGITGAIALATFSFVIAIFLTNFALWSGISVAISGCLLIASLLILNSSDHDEMYNANVPLWDIRINQDGFIPDLITDLQILDHKLTLSKGEFLLMLLHHWNSASYVNEHQAKTLEIIDRCFFR